MVVDPATSHLPEVMTSGEVAAALRQDLFTIQTKLRSGVLPGFKLAGGRWRVKRSDVEAILAGQTTPSAEQRRELLGDDTIKFLQELAANAPALTSEQKDTIRAAFRGGG